jgi:ParB family transcriptional regulator, chromosome partitioning protein
MSDPSRRLGRGLGALIAGPSQPQTSAPDESQTRRLPLAQIRPNPYQPRREFNADELAELENSLRANGLIQPITVRPAAGGYELVAGERRLRAATRLGWSDIPALVRDLDDRALLTLALVENLQRADLNPIEEAEGYRRLLDDFGLTQQQVAEAVGKDRSTVANTLRLLNLPLQVRQLLESRHLTLGHARALLAVRNEAALIALAEETVAKQLSVREVERRAKADTQPAEAPAVTEKKQPQQRESAELRHITDLLRRKLQTDVAVTLGAGGNRGDITIAFYSPDDLERLLDIIIGPNREYL